jgi:hypothetical protein
MEIIVGTGIHSELFKYCGFCEIHAVGDLLYIHDWRRDE